MLIRISDNLETYPRLEGVKTDCQLLFPGKGILMIENSFQILILACCFTVGVMVSVLVS